jgi:hypothetical protein
VLPARDGFLGWTLLALDEAAKGGLSDAELAELSTTHRAALAMWHREGVLPHAAALALVILACGGLPQAAILEAVFLTGAGYVMGRAAYPCSWSMAEALATS